MVGHTTQDTGRESDKFMLRLPDGMRDRIKAAADANRRSMNAEIVATLEEKYPSGDPEKMLKAIREIIKTVQEDGGFSPGSKAAYKQFGDLLPDEPDMREIPIMRQFLLMVAELGKAASDDD